MKSVRRGRGGHGSYMISFIFFDATRTKWDLRSVHYAAHTLLLLTDGVGSWECGVP